MDDAEPHPTTPARRARFEALHRAHARAVLAFAIRRAASAEDAADVVADTFLVAWRRLDDVPDGDGARLWLYGVARRVAANHRRGARRRDRLGARLAEHLHPLLLTPDVTATSDDVSAVRAALARLPEDDRELLQLVAWEGLTSTQIGTVMGVPAATVRTRVHRARNRLRAALGDLERIEPPDDSSLGCRTAPTARERIARHGHDVADEQPFVPETGRSQ